MSASANPQAILQSWNVPELQKRLKFVLFALLIFVVGTHIPAPGIDMTAVQAMFARAGDGGLIDLINIFSGGALKQFSILALGVMPYINSSIMFQLLIAVEPKLKEIQQEGEEGRKKISKWTRYLAVALAFLQGGGLMIMIYGDIATALKSFEAIVALCSVVGGTCFLMWLGDEISQKGVGNGVSLIITIGIVASLPGTIVSEVLGTAQTDRLVALILILLFSIAVVAGIVFIQLTSRKIPVQYARRQIGRKIYGGQSTYLPIRITQAGVIPIIFAISVLMVPNTIINFANLPALEEAWGKFNSSIWSPIVQFVLVFVFTYVYTAVTFNTQDIADNLKKNNGFIPGIRPGRPTFEFLDKVLNRVTFFGATFLALIAVMPSIVQGLVTMMTGQVINSFYIGGTSLLIVVGVALDTVQQMQAHMVMRHYSGFSK